MGASVLYVKSFFINVNWIYAITRHHAQPNFNVLLTRNVFVDSDVRQSSHPSMIPLYCLGAIKQ